MSNCAISWIPYSGQTLYTHWFLQEFWPGDTTAAGSQWQLLAWPSVFCLESRKEREKQHHTHIIMLSRKDRDQPHLKSKLHDVTWLLHKQNQPNKKHKKAYAEISPSSPLLSTGTSVCTCTVPDWVKLDNQMQQNKARSWKRRMQQKNTSKSLDKSFWTGFSVVKRLGSVTHGNTELYHAKILSFAFSLSKCFKTCGKFAYTNFSLPLGKSLIPYKYPRVLHLLPVLGLDLPFEVLGLSSFIRDCLKLSSV